MSYYCHLNEHHAGLHAASYDFERITDQVMFDGGFQYQKTLLSITWSRLEMSDIEAGRGTPDWRASLGNPELLKALGMREVDV